MDNINDGKEKLVFLDIDGTLLDHGGIVYPSTREAIERARRNGHRLFLCTGRQRCFVDPQILGMGLTEGVFSAGANVICEENMIFHRSFEEEYYKKAVEVLLAGNSIFCLETVEGALVYGEMQTEYSELISMLLKMNFIFLKELPPSMSQVDKIVVFHSEYSPEQLAAKLGEEFQVVSMSYSFLGEGAEIMQASLNKASGIQKVLEYYHRQQSDTIGIGDGANDLEMFDFCGISVAMGNAVSQIKERADFITADIKKDGLYLAFEKLGLI